MNNDWPTKPGTTYTTTGRINHLAAPGPLYWDFRCTKCDGLVDDHINFIQHIAKRIRGNK